ncbi:MAG: SDR family oxidoreductase [Burkholderiaceae bacterium]|nr:SDR family oxidoreductase [Burkholderiaceae bacterium]
MGTPIQQLFNLSGQVALVTGGSRGLGLQIAESLGEAGAKIMLSSRKAAELEEAVAELGQRGIAARWVAGDASRPEEVERICRETVERLGPVDILVNNAGAAWGAPAEDHPLEAWDKVMNLNLRSVFLFSQWVAKHCMIPRRQGRIVNIASITAFGGNPQGHDTVAYSTSKAGVVNLTRVLAAEWGEHRINVNAIAPGYFPSKMTRHTLAVQGVDAMAAKAPLQRLGDDDDLKGAALLFASAAGKHITGQTLAVDGGVTAVLAQ